MKPLNLEEAILKEEMKYRCLNKGQYIDKNAKAKFDMICHLEDFETQYWELERENQKLKEQLSNSRQMKNQQKYFIEYLNKTIEDLETEDVDDEEMKGYLIQRINTFKEILSKFKEITGVSDDKK